MPIYKPYNAFYTLIIYLHQKHEKTHHSTPTSHTEHFTGMDQDTIQIIVLFIKKRIILLFYYLFCKKDLTMLNRRDII